jgi:beta-lactam-binding protein with PASTA domain
MYKILFLFCSFLSLLNFEMNAAVALSSISKASICFENTENQGVEKAKAFLQKLTIKHKRFSPDANLTYEDKLVIFGTGIAGAILSGLFLVNGATFLAIALLLLGVSAALYIFWMKTGKGPKWLPRLPY